MRYRRLGRTDLNLSILSLGSGGPNQFGQMRYVPRKDICRLVRCALDFGINYFDTASAYSDSESLLGEALDGVPRDRYYLSSKVFPLDENVFINAAEVRRRVERSLRKLRVDTLDICCFHKVRPELYSETLERLLPTLQDLRTEGKIRYIGISESSNHDSQHSMLKRALQDDLFDTIMVSYHCANRSAEQHVFPMAQANDVGVIGMLPARHLVHRNALGRVGLFSRTLLSCFASRPRSNDLVQRLRVAFSALRQPSSNQELSIPRQSGDSSLVLPAAGNTFAISHPAVSTVLTGTTDVAHLEQNVRAALARKLTPMEIDQLEAIFQQKDNQAGK
jgi:L-galactose dehydrogenase